MLIVMQYETLICSTTSIHDLIGLKDLEREVAGTLEGVAATQAQIETCAARFVSILIRVACRASVLFVNVA